MSIPICVFFILFYFILTYSLNNWFTVGWGNPPYEQLGPGWKVDSDRQVSCLKGHAKPAFFARRCYFYHLGLHTTKNTKTAVAFADIFNGKNRKRYYRSESNKIATSDGHPSAERRFLFDFPPKFRVAGPLMRVKKSRLPNRIVKEESNVITCTAGFPFL